MCVLRYERACATGPCFDKKISEFTPIFNYLTQEVMSGDFQPMTPSVSECGSSERNKLDLLNS
jgi:hypothetical protein